MIQISTEVKNSEMGQYTYTICGIFPLLISLFICE